MYTVYNYLEGWIGLYVLQPEPLPVHPPYWAAWLLTHFWKEENKRENKKQTNKKVQKLKWDSASGLPHRKRIQCHVGDTVCQTDWRTAPCVVGLDGCYWGENTKRETHSFRVQLVPGLGQNFIHTRLIDEGDKPESSAAGRGRKGGLALLQLLWWPWHDDGYHYGTVSSKALEVG